MSSNDSPWVSVCKENDITPDTGVCALLNEKQVAIFKDRTSNNLFAIDNYDPIGKANVLSRGILGSIGEKIVVASPLFKQHFCLQTGQCLEEDCSVATYQVRVENGEVQISP